MFPLGKDLPLDALMSRVREEVSKRRSQEAAASDDHDGDIRVTKRLPRWSAAASRLPVKPSYGLADLLQFADEEFVLTAYRIVLRRPADADGLKSFLDAMRNGLMSKVEVLGALRFSDEGRRNDVHIDGLLIPYKLHRLRRVPVLGRILAFGMALVRLPRLSMLLQSTENASARATQEVGHLVNRLVDDLESHFRAIDEDIGEAARESALNRAEVRAEALEVRAGAVEVEAARLRATVERLKAQIDELEARRAEDLDSLRKSANEGRRGLIDIQRKVMALASAPPALGAEPQESIRPSAPTEVLRMAASIIDAEYASFEDAFRGHRDDIKQRAAYYLTVLDQAGISPSTGLVVDLGCGRGEWLELLRENGFTARGADLNPVMLDDARQHGLDVVESDVIAYLAGLPDASVAAITSMHLVEHLPYEVLIQLLDEARRVLIPAGVLALETPNPENITVGSCWFYLDPTHRNPIPPALLQWVVGNRGFEMAEIHRLSEHRGLPALERVPDEVAGAAQINEMIGWFVAAPDYAIVARKS